MRKYSDLIISTVVLAVANVLIWLRAQQTDLQLAWVAFILVWVDLVFSWLIMRSQRKISYIFIATAAVVEVLVTVYIFWVLQRSI